MATQIFVNLPVKNLNRSIEFFRKLGYTFNPQFTDENATCMIISDTIFVMLVVEPLFLNFTKNELCDTRKYTESIICLSAESRDAVDEMVKKAVAAGATTPVDKQDHGWMYGHGFQDMDGHLWEIAYMDINAMPQ